MKTTLYIIIAVMILSAAACLASEITFGDINIDSPDIELSDMLITAKKATITTSTSKISAGLLRVELTTAKNGEFAVKKSTASDKVKIFVKQTDKTTKTTSTIDATADKVVMITGEDKIILTGNVVVNATYPGISKPIVSKGETVTVYLKERRVHVQGDKDQGELTIPPKEVEQK